MKRVLFSNIQSAFECLEGIANRTPICTTRTIDSLVGASVSFKCENFQRTGAFKFRGAYYALSQLTPEQKREGVITYSSGNHAQAVALAGRLLNISCSIIMPEDAPSVKLAATRNYGGNIILYDRKETTRERLARDIAQRERLVLIPPYDHPDILSGQGTAAIELFEQSGQLDYLLVCCGGGGLLSGSALAAEMVCPSCKVIGVEPSNANDAYRTFHSGTLQRIHNPNTIADGARTPFLGQYTFPLIMEYVTDMVTVTEDQIIQALRFLWERMKLIVEPTGALATAALLAYANRFTGARVGVIISGGNLDLSQMARYS